MPTATVRDVEEMVQQGVAALNAGDRERAWNLLASAIKQDQQSQSAWYHMASATTNPQEQRTCYMRVAAINPNNELGRHAATWLDGTAPVVSAVAVSQVSPQAEPVHSLPPVQGAQILVPTPLQARPPIEARQKETSSPAVQPVVQVRLSSGMLWIVVLLLLTLVSLNAYSIYTSHQMLQIEAQRATDYEARISAIRTRAQTQRDLIGNLFTAYQTDAYDNPSVDRISEQQLTAAEYTIQMLRLIGIQNSDMIDLMAAQP